MTKDILERAKAVAEKCTWKDESVDHAFWAFKAAEILPEAIAEVERLRSREQHFSEMSEEMSHRLKQYVISSSDRMNGLLDDADNWVDDWIKLEEDVKAKDARIKELKAVISEAFRELVTAGPDIGDIAAMSISLAIRKLASQNKRLEAAFMEAKRCPTCNGAGKLIDVVISRKLGRVESERVCPLCEGKGEEKAREALEEMQCKREE